MDFISINNLNIYAYHGVNLEEKENGQNFIFDIKYYLNIARACHTDDVNDTVSYAKVVKLVTKVFTERKFDLIERAAQVVADEILDNFSEISKVEITLKKPEAPIKADFENVAVTIFRDRN